MAEGDYLAALQPLSVGRLLDLISAADMDASGCIEKEDLLEVAAAALASITEVQALRVRELFHLVSAGGLDGSDCIDKTELVRVATKALEHLSAPPPSKSSSGTTSSDFELCGAICLAPCERGRGLYFKKPRKWSGRFTAFLEREVRWDPKSCRSSLCVRFSALSASSFFSLGPF